MTFTRLIGLPNVIDLRGTTIFAIGDSITATGYANQGSMTGNILTAAAWLEWAALLSNARLQHMGVSGTAGFTAAQILNTHVPIAIAAGPRICCVTAGTNDAQQAIPFATTKANLIAIYTALVAVGIRPVLCTIPPITGASNAIRSAIDVINAFVKRYGQTVGFDVVDFHTVLTDTTNGNYLAGFSGDGIHPNATGAKAMGTELATRLSPQVYTGGSVMVDYNGDPGFSPATNQLQLTDTNADGYPDGWSGPNGAPTTTNPVIGGVSLGKYMKMVRTAADGSGTFTASGAANPGDRIYIACRIGATVEASGGVFNALFVNVGQTQKFIQLSGWSKDVPDGSVLAQEFVMPAGLTDFTVALNVQVNTVAGAEIRIGQVTTLNLTQAGIA